MPAVLSPQGRRYPVTPSVVKPHEEWTPHFTKESFSAIPQSGDLWTFGYMPPIRDQGAEGACTAYGNNHAVEGVRRKQGLPPMTPSEPVTYDLERLMEGTPLSEDAGANGPDGLAVWQASGGCDISLYPVSQADFTTAPPPAILAACAAHKLGKWVRVGATPEAIMAVLATGFPVAFGMWVYESFESAAVAATGNVPVPAAGEKKLGGHWMVHTGWDVTQDGGSHGATVWDWFLDRLEGSVPEDGTLLTDNSWGTVSWGWVDPLTGLHTGRCRIPFQMWRRGYCFDAIAPLVALG